MFQTLYFEDLVVGMRETISKTVENEDVIGFAELSGDHNPIHLSEHFARKTRFGGRIVHGLYTASLISAGHRHAAARPGGGLHFPDPELSWSGQDRGRGGRQCRGCRTDREGTTRSTAVRMPGRRQNRLGRPRRFKRSAQSEVEACDRLTVPGPQGSFRRPQRRKRDVWSSSIGRMQ